MRAVVLTSHGGPEVLGLTDVPDPEPGPEEVVVGVVATSVNRADLLQRRGRYPGPPAEFEIPGLEVAGRVVARGERATRFGVGDTVMGIVAGGGYAERIAVHERQLMAVPAGLNLTEAGGVPEVFITAWDALVARGGLRSGGVALVHAGASGVGTAAIQVARALGARVVTTASAGKLAACRDLGADAAVDYASGDVAAAVAEVTGGRGVDVVLDVVGGDYLDANLRALAVGGRIVQVGVMGGASAAVNLGVLVARRATLVGTVLRPRPLEEKIAVTLAFEREVAPWFTSGTLRPVIDSRFPLDAVADAHRRMEDNANVGKILLEVAGDPG